MAVRSPRSLIAPEGPAFRIAMVSGSTGLTTCAAGGTMFSMLWTNTAKRCLVWRFNWWWATLVAYGAAQEQRHSLYIARGTTVANSGGTAATLTTTNALLDSLGTRTSVMGDMRMCTTAALTEGTTTRDSQAILSRPVWVSNALIIGNTANITVDDQFGLSTSTNPITLRAGEQLELVNDILMGATGVIRLTVEVEWSEVDVGVA
jgi:hypothetical protein